MLISHLLLRLGDFCPWTLLGDFRPQARPHHVNPSIVKILGTPMVVRSSTL